MFYVSRSGFHLGTSKNEKSVHAFMSYSKCEVFSGICRCTNLVLALDNIGKSGQVILDRHPNIL